MSDNAISFIVAVVGGFISYCFNITPFFEFLIWAIALDLFTGVVACFVNDNLMFNSKRLSRGVCKKIVILTLVAFSHELDIMLHLDVICSTVTFFFIGSDGLSVLENCAKIGIPLPRVLVRSLEQVKELGCNYESKNR